MSGVFDEEAPWIAASADSDFSINVRIACIGIALYDFVLTLPAELRMYRSARRRNRISVPAVLFFLVRYISVLVFIIGNYLHWAGYGFSEHFCRGFWFLPAVFKCLQAMIVQFILGWRTYKISRMSRRVLYFLAILYVLVVTTQWFTSFFDRFMMRPQGYCSSGNVKFDVIWGFYFSSSVWDITTLAISLWYLLRIKTSSPFISKLARTMLVDGLMYFVAMTIVNVVNMFVFLNSSNPVRKGSVTVAYTASWIFSQRILINLHKSATERRAAATFPTHTVTTAAGGTSVEALSQEVSARLKSARDQTGSVSRSYCQRLQGTLQSSSGGYLDSYITIEVTPQDSSVESEIEKMPSEGLVHPVGNEDSLDRKPDCELGKLPYA